MAGQDFTVSIVGNVTGFDVAPINNLSNALRQLPPATNPAVTSGQQLTNTFNQTGQSASQLNSPLNTVKTSTAATGQQFTTTGTNAKGLQQTLTPLGAGFGQVSTGSNATTQTLNQLVGSLQTTTGKSKETEAGSVSLGEKIALMGGFITTTVGHVFGLIEGFTGLETAQLSAERMQLRVNITQVAAEKAQDNYNKVVKQFGPESHQAEIALANLQNKNEANRLATEKSEIAQKKLQEAYVSFGLEVVNTVGELATMGSTISILLTKMGLKTAATTIDTDAQIANYLAAKSMTVGLSEEELAAQGAAGGIGEADVATLGLTGKLLLIAAPLVAAGIAFALIETNTFGMGDAFRTVAPQIGSAIDTIVNGIAMIWNAIIRITEVIVEWGGNTINTFVGVYNAINTFLDQVVVGFTNLGIDIQNSLKQISVFFANNLIIPITNAWGIFNQGFKDAWQATVNTIADIFKPAAQAILDTIKTIIDAGAKIPGYLGDPFREAQKAIAGAEEALKKVGTQAGTTGTQASDAFKPIPPIILKGTDEIQRMTTSGLYPLSNAFVDTSGTLKILDGLFIQNAGTIKTGAAGFLDYYSHINNVSGALKSNLGPAIQSTSKFINDNVKELTGWFNPAGAMESKTKDIGGAMGDASKKTKDFSQTLAENIAKQNETSAAMLKSISTGQQYQKTLSDLGKALAEATVKTADLTTKLTDATAIQQRHSIAVQEGINKALEFGIKLQDDATTTATYNTALEQATGFTEKFGGIIPPTTANLELLAKAMAGDGEAATKLMTDFINATRGMTEAGKGLIDDMSKVFDNLGKSFKENKAIKEIPKDLRKIMSPEAIDFEVVQAEWQATIGKMTTGMAAEFAAAGGKFNAAGIEAVRSYMQRFGDQKAVRGSPEMKSFFNQFDQVFATAQQQGGAAGQATITSFLAKMEAAGGGGAAAAQKIAEIMGIGPQVATLAAKAGTAAGGALANGVTSGTGVVPGALQKNVIDPFTGLPTTAQAVALKIADAFNKLSTAFDQLPGYFLSVFTKSFVTNLLTPLGIASKNLGTFVTGIGSAFNQIPIALAPLWTKAFVTSLIGPLASGKAAITKWVNDIEVQVSNMVTNINRIIATIKPPALAGPALPTGPGPQAPIKIPAPDLTLFEAGLAKMQTDANNAFAAIVNLAKTQFKGISTALNAAIALANTAWTSLETGAATAFINILGGLAEIRNGFNLAFTQGVAAAIVAVTSLETAIATAFVNIITALAQVSSGFNSAFTQGVASAIVAVTSLEGAIATVFVAIIAALEQLATAFTTAFNRGAQNAAGIMNQLATNVQTNIANMIAASNAIPIAFTSNFNKAAVNAAGSMNALAVNEETNIANMIAATNAFAIAITKNFGTGASNAAGSMNSLATNVNTNVNNMVTKLNNVVTMFNNIRSSIQSAQTAVGNLISAINNIPTSKTVNVNIVEHITQQVTRVPVASVGAAATRGSATTTTAATTVLTPGIAPKARIIKLEITEPTVVKLNDRELIKLINKKLLELDIGALV